jgi:hypothetical protein
MWRGVCVYVCVCVCWTPNDTATHIHIHIEKKAGHLGHRAQLLPARSPQQHVCSAFHLNHRRVIFSFSLHECAAVMLVRVGMCVRVSV